VGSDPIFHLDGPQRCAEVEKGLLVTLEWLIGWLAAVLEADADAEVRSDAA
jgi:hypothetical protein